MRYFTNGLLFALLFACFIQVENAEAQPKLIDKIAGIVGDNIILLSDVEIQYQQMLAQDPTLSADVKCQLLDQLMAQKMYLTQAMVDSIEITEEEVETELDRRLRYFMQLIGSKEKLEEYYGKSILEIKDEFREEIREQLLSQSMESRVFKDLKVTPAEVRTFFNEIPEDSLPYFNAEVEVGQIVVFPEVAREQRKLALEKIEDLRKRVIEGEDFETLALIYSEDPGSAAEGGDVGFIERGETAAEFEAAAFNLEKDEVSEVVETIFGFHVLQLIERKGERAHIRHILVKPQITSYDLEFSADLLDSVRALIIAKTTTFGQAAEKFSEDESSKNNGGILTNPETGGGSFELDQLERSLFLTVEKMDVGEVSQPMLFKTPTEENAYRIVYLQSRTEPHKASLEEDYNKIQAAALASKQAKALKVWFSKKSQNTYIFVDDEHSDCPELNKWKKHDESARNSSY